MDKSSKSAGSGIPSRRSRFKSKARRGWCSKMARRGAPTTIPTTALPTPLPPHSRPTPGYPYAAAGRVLIDPNPGPGKEMSMKRIRDWMAANPDEAPKVRATNRSYVFFHVTGLSNEGEPVGAQGVPLIPGRSIAVDKIHVYGTPFFIDASLPIESAKPNTPFRRLIIAQDTGSAIARPAHAYLDLVA